MMGKISSVKKRRYKKVKLLEMEDRISDLPDSIIHHILSFLPSIIQTCVLSKRWKNQWTHVPVLTFDLSDMTEEYVSASQFVYSTLSRYDCPKIKKFRVLEEGDCHEEYPHINESISFAVRKHAEEIILQLLYIDFLLPGCIFNHSSLVNLHLLDCKLKPDGEVCLVNLKELFLGGCLLSDQAVHNILRGSPVLESLVLETCSGCDHLVIDSKSLKKLELGSGLSVLEIACPNLQQLNLVHYLSADWVKLVDLPSLNHATLDFDKNIDESASMEIFKHLQHVKDLKLGTCFMEFLSNLEVRAAPSLPLLSNKCLTLDSPNFDKHSAGIAHALYSSHLLEKLMITRGYCEIADFPGSAENHWSSSNVVFTCLGSHLKVVEIRGFSKKYDDYKHVLNFIEFILKNAKVLEKLVVIFEKGGFGFEFDVSLEICDVSLEICGFTRCSPLASVKLLR